MHLNCEQFEKTMFMLLTALQIVETTFSNFQEGFCLISLKLHRLHIKFYTQSVLNMTTFGTKISIMFEKKLAGCESEQAPLMLNIVEPTSDTDFFGSTFTFNQFPKIILSPFD